MGTKLAALVETIEAMDEILTKWAKALPTLEEQNDPVLVGRAMGEILLKFVEIDEEIGRKMVLGLIQGDDPDTMVDLVLAMAAASQ
jgi:hypothetical protein